MSFASNVGSTYWEAIDWGQKLGQEISVPSCDVMMSKSDHESRIMKKIMLEFL